MAWWLVDSILKGTLDEDYPIMKKSEKDVTIVGGGGTETIAIEGAVDTVSIDQSWWEDDGHSLVGNPYYGASANDTISFDLSSSIGAADTVAFTGTHVFGGMGEDHISFNYSGFDMGNVVGYNTGAIDSIDFKPKPDLKGPSHHKYQEDKGIKDLQDYVSSTYKGHYTNENSDTQTLDLIHSVGDAESFCRSNALKYLSRYDKKGSAKNDILKAMHYCLLLYYFSGNTQEPDYTNTRYESF